MYINEKHKEIVENRGYKYIGSYKWNEVTIDKKFNNINTYIRVKCPYCGVEHDITFQAFKNGINCSKCCNKYENSFACYIQHELKEPLNKYWDWEKNTVNPYCISRGNSNKKIWIKCTNKDYHGSYLITCNNFLNGKRCPYCNKNSGRVHSKDSFGQWLIDKYGDNALDKYWSDKNIVDPFAIAPQSNKKSMD